MTPRGHRLRLLLAAALLAPPLLWSAAGPLRPAAAQPAAHSPDEAGKHVYRKANCVGCHKWHGGGGGGYGGAALSLRQTALDREQIIEVVSCGRPSTGMPYHERDAYADKERCGATAAELGDAMPPKAPEPLRRPEIEAVADYVLRNIRGRGEPSYAECVAFWGSESKMCHSYQAADAAGARR
jgi:mono/diheme cytochrome c family protein